MLVDLKEVSVSGRELGTVSVNPRHVILVRKATNSSDPDAQAFTTQLIIEHIGPLTVEGSPTDVRRQLNVGSIR